MKQARESDDGANRREVEKTWGRNEAGGWELPRSARSLQNRNGGVDVDGDAAKRAGTPAGVVARTRGDREESEDTSKRRGRPSA
jgi:hypothetical protein